MAQYVAIRASQRSAKVRILDSSGAKQTLTTTSDVVVDLDNAAQRRALNYHKAIGQYVVTAANNTYGVAGSKATLPANS